MKIVILAIAILTIGNSHRSLAQLPTKMEVISQVTSVNNYWISNNSDPGNNKWARSIYFMGNMSLYKVYQDNRFYNYSLHWADKHYWALKEGSTTRNADNQCAGQTYLDLYETHSNPRYQMIGEINSSVLNMVASDKSSDWWWVDALFMAMPVFTRLGKLLEKPDYSEKMYELYAHTKYIRSLYNEQDHLWYRDKDFIPPFETENGQPSYWSRGNGWVLAAHALTLNYMSDEMSHRDEYITTYLDMIEAIVKLQRSDGFWNVSLYDSLEYPGPESSGTCLFIYSLAWGINNNILTEDIYYQALLKAWNGITTLSIQPSGKFGLVQGVGKQPSSSQPVTNKSTSDFGVGVFLLAASEIYKLATGIDPEPPDTPRFEDYEIQLFPNPVSSILNLSNLTLNSTVQIWNIQGILVSEYHNLVDDRSLDIDHIPSGVYYLRIISDYRNETFRFIKN